MMDARSDASSLSSSMKGEKTLTKGIVIFDSKYGNTERIAKALASGLQGGGVEVECIRCDRVPMDRLTECDLLAVGGPTQYGTISAPLKEFLGKLPPADVRGKQAFAFDTRYADERAGSAAKDIQTHLENMGLGIVRGHASAIVLGGEGPLEQGAEDTFKGIGADLAKRFQ